MVKKSEERRSILEKKCPPLTIIKEPQWLKKYFVLFLFQNFLKLHIFTPWKVALLHFYKGKLITFCILKNGKYLLSMFLTRKVKWISKNLANLPRKQILKNLYFNHILTLAKKSHATVPLKTEHQTMYSYIGVSFHETVPLRIHFNYFILYIILTFKTDGWLT